MKARVLATIGAVALSGALIGGAGVVSADAASAPSGTTTTVTTYPYPVWWSGAAVTQIQINRCSAGASNCGSQAQWVASKDQVELLPQGVSIAAPYYTLIPWANVLTVKAA
jgi:hypothetical protein